MHLKNVYTFHFLPFRDVYIFVYVQIPYWKGCFSLLGYEMAIKHAFLHINPSVHWKLSRCYTKWNDVLVINASRLVVNCTSDELHDPVDNQCSLVSAVTKWWPGQWYWRTASWVWTEMSASHSALCTVLLRGHCTQYLKVWWEGTYILKGTLCDIVWSIKYLKVMTTCSLWHQFWKYTDVETFVNNISLLLTNVTSEMQLVSLSK
jgi:hypothetical protein